MKIKKAPGRELFMPGGGLEPPYLAALVPETSVSANSTIRAVNRSEYIHRREGHSQGRSTSRRAKKGLSSIIIDVEWGGS